MKKIFFYVLLLGILFGSYRFFHATGEKKKPVNVRPTTVGTLLNDVSSPAVPRAAADVSASDDLRIVLPATDALVSSPFLVQGTIRLPATDVVVRVLNDRGDALIVANVRVFSREGDAVGTFAVPIRYAFVHTTKGFLEAVHAVTGDERRVRVPVRFTLTAQP